MLTQVRRSIGPSMGPSVCRKAGQNVRVFEDKIALTDDFRFSLDDASIIAGLENKATRSGRSASRKVSNLI